jgi:hypothetical protein
MPRVTSTVAIGVDVVGVADFDAEGAGARHRDRDLALAAAAFDRHRHAGLGRDDLVEDAAGLGQRMLAGGQRLAAGGQQHVAGLQADARGTAAGQHTGHLQALVHAEGDVGRLVIVARVGPAVLGGEAEQVARLALAQFGVLDEEGRGDLVQAVLLLRHFGQGVGRGRHLRRQPRRFRRALDGARRALDRTVFARGAGRQQHCQGNAHRGQAQGRKMTDHVLLFLFILFSLFRCCRNRRHRVRSTRTLPRY